MKILVSACLLGRNCKYDGGNNRKEPLCALAERDDVEMIPVCPEMLGGLPCPRIPGEISDGVVRNRDGTSVDAYFRRGAETALETAKRERIDFAVLQSRSPSCGVKEVYDGTFTGRKIPGKGVFAQLLDDNGIKIIDVEDFLELCQLNTSDLQSAISAL